LLKYVPVSICPGTFIKNWQTLGRRVQAWQQTQTMCSLEVGCIYSQTPKLLRWLLHHQLRPRNTELGMLGADQGCQRSALVEIWLPPLFLGKTEPLCNVNTRTVCEILKDSDTERY